MTEHSNRLKCELYNDSMQNWKSKPIQKAQLIIADVPYNVGTNFYGSNPVWYKGGKLIVDAIKEATLCIKDHKEDTAITILQLCNFIVGETFQEGPTPENERQKISRIQT